MLHIICPKNNIPERTYAVDVLFNRLLGYGLSADDICFDDAVSDYIIVLDEKTIIIEDHFFQKHLTPLSYLDSKNIPETCTHFHGMGLEIPIIYGEDKYVENEESITIGLDIFASTFFMLTRWEESVLGRENKGDCDETQLFTVINEIYQRPLVHEYEQLLQTVLAEYGIQFKERAYKVVMSHDVDGFLPPTYTDIAKSVIRQFRYGPPKNRVLNLTWREKIKYKKAFPSTFSQFELYTKLCNQHDVAEWFYFKVCEKGEVECTYNHDASQTIEVVKRLKGINSSKIVLGFHPSQSTFGNERQWLKEAERIHALLGYLPNIGRNHHLLYNYEMLRMWESLAEGSSNGVIEISNCVFHNKIGFRSGVAVPYILFDIYQRRPMKLREHPCQIMDTVIRYHGKYQTKESIWDEIKSVIEFTKQYNCELVLTWHIYIRNKKLIKEYYQWCENVVKYATN